jgi:hypothetical protein
MPSQLLALLVDVKRALRDDDETPFAQRLDRDREIGRDLSALSDVDRLAHWWRVVAEQPQPTTGERVARLRRVVIAVLCLIGAVTGMSVSSVVFGYEGAYPVNLFALLGVVVGIPALLLAFTLVALPGWLPGLAALRDAVSAISPSRWMGAWLDRYSQLDLFSTFSDRRRRSSFARCQLLVFSQWLGVGFFIGVLLVAWLLVVVTDLAFGWSTTLQTDSTIIHGALSAIATPWSSWLPVATPDLSLVEASRFYRLERDGVEMARAVLMGEWWPFVMMVVIVYGLLPRILVLCIASVCLRRATRSLLVADSDTTALLDRLALPTIAYNAEATDEGVRESTMVATPPSHRGAQATQILVWNDAVSAQGAGRWLKQQLGIPCPGPISLSVLQDAAERSEALKSLEKGVRRLVIFTKGWEPPLLEFSDLIEVIRGCVGAETSLTIVPLDVPGEKVQQGERDVWAQALTKVDDARLYVVEADQ